MSKRRARLSPSASFRLPTRSPDDLSGLGPSVATVLEHLHAIDKYVAHTSGKLVRLCKCGVILNSLGIKDDDIRVIAGL